MRDSRNDNGPRFALTDQGREALQHAERCKCRLGFEGLLLQCHECETVYGVFRDWNGSGASAVPKPA